MANSYLIVQERYEGDYESSPTRDEYPIAFASVDEARARFNRDGPASMFEHEGNTYYIAELAPYRDGISYTGRTFEIS